MPAGDPVDVYTISNGRGLGLRVLNYGGIIASLSVPDRDGRVADVVLGHDSLDHYIRDTSYFGAIIGRVVNRISGSRFIVDGKEYRLAANRPPNHLHGGLVGFDRVVWRATPFHEGRTDAGLNLEYRSPDGEEGYPGNLDVKVRYTVADTNEVMVDFFAISDQPTPVNLTQHSYFNLAGHNSGDILGHGLRINADEFTPMRDDFTPTGTISPVAGTPFDFRAITAIGARIGADDEQLRIGAGYDHNFVLTRAGPGLTHAAHLVEPGCGRTLDVYTTEPGLQLYAGNFIEGVVPGKGGRRYGPRSGLSLETQRFPDAPNHPNFPSIILRPGHEYRSRTVFRFGVTG
jgi:aldose 1-epimerase